MTKYIIKPTSRYKRELRAAVRRGLDLSELNTVITLLANGEPLPEVNRDHALNGNFKGYRECHVQNDWLLIYKYKDDILVLSLERTGTHSDLFRK